MSKIEIRKAGSGDEKILAYIQTESWKAAFGDILSKEMLIRCTNIEKAEKMYEGILKNPDIHMLIEYVDEKPHCIAAWSLNRNDLGIDVAELICIHSLCDNWHKGYGSVMMYYALEEMRKAGYIEVILWVFEKNTSARKFYEKHGFSLTEKRQEAVGEIEVMYLKTL